MHHKIKNLLSWLLFPALFLPLSLPAQEQKTPVVPVEQNTGQMKTVIRGTVVDENGQPLPGAKVQLISKVPKYKVVTTGITDADGRFTFDMKDAQLYVIVEYIGFKTFEARARKNTDITIQLTPDEHTLKETVVTGFYSKARNSFTGTAVQVGGDELFGQ